MRVDHHAYQRATRIAGVGFLAQLGVGLTLVLFSQIPQVKDTAILYGGLYVLIGVLPWLGLIILFNQHKLERLEALEYDEVLSDTSAFDEEDEVRVAAKRLRRMHGWMIPAYSLVIAAVLAGVGALMWRHLKEYDVSNTEHLGWAVALCLAFTAMSFIMSRFIAGMSKLEAWENLRGGAAFMVGNSLVMLGVAVGMGFRFFDNDGVVAGIANAIPYFMFLQAAEIVANFVLNLYRPRVPGEVPRPAFDSKLLSMLAAPDNLVRSINEAVNYQFGFDITSSWGYKLLIRSLTSLIALGVIVVVALNMLVVVEPQQQALRLSGGERVDEEPHKSGLMFKLPWPLQTAEVHEVSRVRTLALTGQEIVGKDVHLWGDNLGHQYDRPLEPFIVGAEDIGPIGNVDPDDEEQSAISGTVSLMDLDISFDYRIADDGLLDYLDFATDEKSRRQEQSPREQALTHIALREVMMHLASMSFDDVLADARDSLAEDLRAKIDAAMKRNRTGIDVLAVNLPLVRPRADENNQVLPKYEDLAIAVQQRDTGIAEERERTRSGYTEILGDQAQLQPVLDAIEAWEELRRNAGPEAPETIEQRIVIERMLIASGGTAGQAILEAGRDRWVRVLEARTQASRVAGQHASFAAFPEYFMQREIMQVYEQLLPGINVTILGVRPDSVSVDLEVKELDPLTDIYEALEKEQALGGDGK